MNSVEVEGRSIDEAVAKALEFLQVPRDRVTIEILADASRGIFGLGAQRARVRVTLAALGREVSRETIGVAPMALPGNQPALNAKAREFLDVIVGHLADSPRIEERYEAGSARVRFELSGVTSGLLIGKGGRTLDALEYLLNLVVLRAEAGAVPIRFEIDVEGYRARRAEFLEGLAHRSAAKASETGRPVVLNPMSPRERRLIHLALKDEQGVTSESEGHGELRRVVVRPVGQRPPARTR